MEDEVMSNIIGLNPTGTIDFNGTYKMNGVNNIVRNSKDSSKDNLEKISKNEISCDLIENFNNYEKKQDFTFLFLFVVFILIFFILNFI